MDNEYQGDNKMDFPAKSENGGHGSESSEPVETSERLHTDGALSTGQRLNDDEGEMVIEMRGTGGETAVELSIKRKEKLVGRTKPQQFDLENN